MELLEPSELIAEEPARLGRSLGERKVVGATVEPEAEIVEAANEGDGGLVGIGLTTCTGGLVQDAGGEVGLAKASGVFERMLM